MKNTVGHLMVMSFIIAIADRFSASLESLIKGNDGQGTNPEITLNPVDLYIKKNISSATTITPLLDANTKKLRGVVSFDANGRLSQNRAVVFNKIFVGYATNAAADMEGNLVYNTAPIAALYNADLVIRQDGREVLKKNVSSLINVGTPQNPQDGYAELENLRYLKDDEEVEIDLEFPAGVSMPAAATANQYIFVKISGYETQRKEKK
ncbi:hypothetical protein [Flagellimonas marina]|uniref:Uncharacterized protein n=1 Tax=Flagellimonas marina TaxID=1775168 RepID=A0ABV8PIS2_9FLAO